MRKVAAPRKEKATPIYRSGFDAGPAPLGAPLKDDYGLNILFHFAA